MLKYTIRRMIQSVITIFLIATIVFLLMRLLPTDYYFTEDELMHLNDEQREEILKEAGLRDLCLSSWCDSITRLSILILESHDEYREGFQW